MPAIITDTEPFNHADFSTRVTQYIEFTMALKNLRLIKNTLSMRESANQSSLSNSPAIP